MQRSAVVCDRMDVVVSDMKQQMTATNTLTSREESILTRRLTLAGITLDNHLMLTTDVVLSGSMHAEQLPRTVSVPSVVLITQAAFILEH